MAAAALRLTARQRHVDFSELEHLEALADGFDAAERIEQRSQPVGWNSEHLDVDIFGGRRAAKQTIAHPSTDDQRAAAGGAHRLGDLQRGGIERGHGAGSGLRPHFFTSRSENAGAIALRITRPRDILYGYTSAIGRLI